jgi:hypothetical protein
MRASAPLAARVVPVAILGLLLPSGSFAAGVPTHPRAYARSRHHAVYVAAASVSHHGTRRSGSASARLAAEERPAEKRSAEKSKGDRRGHARDAAQHPLSRRAARREARREAKLEAKAESRREAIAASHPVAVPVPANAAVSPKQFQQDQQAAAEAPKRQETFRARLANFFMSPFRGTHESLVRQNQRDQQDGLTRIQDDADISRQVQNHTLVSIPAVAGLTVDERLPENRRYTRPWTAHFLADLARAHQARFGSDLQVNSAVRTVQFQKRLMHINGNAAPASGDTASSHLMGTTVDLAKRNMSPQEIQWMRAWLWPLQQAGRIDVEEEFKQSCFHIAVYKSYVSQMPEKFLADGAQPRLRIGQSPSSAEN